MTGPRARKVRGGRDALAWKVRAAKKSWRGARVRDRHFNLAARRHHPHPPNPHPPPTSPSFLLRLYDLLRISWGQVQCRAARRRPCPRTRGVARRRRRRRPRCAPHHHLQFVRPSLADSQRPHRLGTSPNNLLLRTVPIRSPSLNPRPGQITMFNLPPTATRPPPTPLR